MSRSSVIAHMLLDLACVKFDAANPFRYSSGLLSPIYTDNRRLISFPDARTQLIETFLVAIKTNNLAFDVVAGTATAGIPHAAWIADHLNVPLVYVRSKAKAHGQAKQVEGVLEAGQRVLLIEDLISTGASAINAVHALRQLGVEVNDCFAIFSYGFSTVKNLCASEKLQLHTLCDFDVLLRVAQDRGIIDGDVADSLLRWRQASSGLVAQCLGVADSQLVFH